MAEPELAPGQEIKELRTEHRKVFATKKFGVLRSVESKQPVHARRGGRWVDASGLGGKSSSTAASTAQEFERSLTGAASASTLSPATRLLGSMGYYTMNSTQLTDRSSVAVNPATGNVLLTASDLNLPGVDGLALGFAHFHNSLADGSTDQMLGEKWTSSVGQDVRLSVDSATQTATFQGPSGYQVEMAYLGNGQWEQPKGLDATLSKGGSGYNYTLRFNKTGQVFRFIGDAKLDRIENASGHRLVMGYDGERLTSVTDTRGEVTRLAYDSAGRLTTVTDPRGRTNSYAYSSGDLVSWTDAAGQTTRYSYDSAHRVTSVTDARGGITRLAYDPPGRATSVTWANGGVTRYSYGSEGQVTMTDPNGNAWEYDFDGLGRMQSLDTPRGGSPITRSYDANSSVTDYTNASGGIGTLSYDGYNVESVLSDNGATSTLEYNDPDEWRDPRWLVRVV